MITREMSGNWRTYLERAIVLTRGEHITSEDLPNLAEHAAAASDGSIRGTVESIERSMIIEALVNADWVQTKAALALGLSERMLRYKIKKYNIVRSSRSISTNPAYFPAIEYFHSGWYRYLCLTQYRMRSRRMAPGISPLSLSGRLDIDRFGVLSPLI